MTLHDIRERAAAFARTPRGRLLAKILRGAVGVGIAGFLVYRLTQIGWGDVLTSLPRTPWFYVIAAAMYFLLPLGETVIYRTMWGVEVRRLFGVLLRKKVLNQDVLNYSGEVYFLAWARRRVDVPGGTAVREVKDNLIVSSIASTIAAVAVLSLFLFAGVVDPADFIEVPSAGLLVGAGVAVVLAGSLLVRFRHALFTVGGKMMGVLWAVHLGRFVLSNVLQVLQWYVVVPDAPFAAWAVLLTALVITNRIPLLPSKDLLFVGAGVELSSVLGIPAATVAGMLLVRTVFDKVLNLALFAFVGAGGEGDTAAAPVDERADEAAAVPAGS